MNLELRCVVSNPRAGNGATDFAFSTSRPALLTAARDLLVEQSTATNAVCASVRASAPVERLVYVGGVSSYLAFLENAVVASYAERPTSLQLVDEKSLGGESRSVALTAASHAGPYAAFCKAESPSVWCVKLGEDGTIEKLFKLRSDLEGGQENVNVIDGVFARVRGKVATKAKARPCPVVAIDVHPKKPLVAAAYSNGIVRVWDVSRKAQRSHLDAQLLIGERIVDIALHPKLEVVAACTSQGRLLTFQVGSGLFKHGDEPKLATSKTRDRKRSFRAICFMDGNPSYLLLLAASRRIIVRLVNSSGMIVSSNRYSKPSRPLSVNAQAVLSAQRASGVPFLSGMRIERTQSISLKCEASFGLIGAAFDKTGNVYVYQRLVDGLPAIQRPIPLSIDAGFSHVPGQAFKGPIVVDTDALFAQNGMLFSYELGREAVTQLCLLPRGEVRRIEAARDEAGAVMAALVFYYADDEKESAAMYAEESHPGRYVLCTKRGDDLAWTVSEPTDGISGCFLNAPGYHDRVMILSASGAVASLFSFAGNRSLKGERLSRGVQRVKLGGDRAAMLFRTPFSSWTAVLYVDPVKCQLAVSKNAFRRPDAFGSSVRESEYENEDDNVNTNELYAMDHRTALSLNRGEVVVDVRWQRLPTGAQGDQYLGAIMTNKRVYFVRDVLEPLSTFEFNSLHRITVPFTPPTICWMGPSLMILFGNTLHSISLDGRADMIAGLSQGEHATAILASLPDRIVYVRPSKNSQAFNPVSVASRPYSALSPLIRGMLSLPTSRSRSGSYYVEKVRVILHSQDASQGSEEVTDALIRSDMSPVAYLLSASDQGRHNMPPLKRAAFLGRIGDLRGALKVVEFEYARLPNADAFHSGTELFRLLQRILNMALASGDFAVAKRCSMLLGRRGTFSAFVDTEGGYSAVTALAQYAKATNNPQIAAVLRPLIDRSAKSSIASDSSRIPSPAEMRNTRQAVDSLDPSAIVFGASDECDVLIRIAASEDEDGNVTPMKEVPLARASPTRAIERLEMLQRVSYAALAADMEEEQEAFIRTDGSVLALQIGARDASQVGARMIGNGGSAVNNADSSEEDDFFVPRGNDLGEDVMPTFAVEYNAPGDDSSRASEHQGSGTQGSLPEETHMAAVEARDRLTKHRSDLNQRFNESRTETRSVMRAQRIEPSSGMSVSETRATESLEKGVRKMNDGRLVSSLREFEYGIKTLANGQQRGQNAPRELVNELVYYRMAMRVRTALEEVEKSPHGNTIPGRITAAQLATSLTALPLRLQHRIEMLVLAVDANMAMNNFGVAGRGLGMIKSLGVPESLRPSLREKYAICSARGFANAQQQVSSRICYHSLRLILPGNPEMRCQFCPAFYSADCDLSLGDQCSCCRIGNIASA